MYCIKCGVKLAPSEAQCPLCGTIPYHPDIPREKSEPLYPREYEPTQRVSPWGALIVLSTLFLAPMIICFLCDFRVSHTVTWSGYVIGALLFGYTVLVLPFWFPKPNPIIFVPVGFGAAALYLFYIEYTVGGSWFLPLALPIVGGAGLIVTAVVTLLRCLRKGRLYIFGGAAIATGGMMLLLEFLVTVTFSVPFIGWFAYPMTALLLLGGLLIFLAICRPARESMERWFFI